MSLSATRPTLPYRPAGAALRRALSPILGPALLPGLALTALLAAAAMLMAQTGWLGRHGLSALTLAMLLGIIIGNTPCDRIAALSGPGVAFSKQSLLRAGVILYGLRLTLADIRAVGMSGILIDALVLTSTFALAWLAGTRLLGLDRSTAILIGAGSAICGAAAVMATAPVVRGKSEQVTVAVATVVLFGTLGIFLYPALYAANLHHGLLPEDTRSFGIFIGSTMHEVAQVFAAGRSISQQTADTAVITKMVRVMMLAPFMILLSAALNRSRRRGDEEASAMTAHDEPAPRIAIPWFAVAFCGVVMLNSLLPIAAVLRTAMLDLDTFLLCIAMAALGLTTQVSSIRRAGAKPLLLATLLFCWLVAGGAAINRLVTAVAAGI